MRVTCLIIAVLAGNCAWFARRVGPYCLGMTSALLLAAGTIVVFAPSAAATESTNTIGKDDLLASPIHYLLSQVRDLPGDGTSQSSDSGIPLGLPTHKSVARAGKSVSSRTPGQTYCFYQITPSLVALPSSLLSAIGWQPHTGVQVSWPMGRSAAESVVLLRRLLI
jgi:hypothetical protein